VTYGSPFLRSDAGDLVDEGIGADGWHYCGYEPGYGVFEDDDLVPL